MFFLYLHTKFNTSEVIVAVAVAVPDCSIGLFLKIILGYVRNLNFRSNLMMIVFSTALRVDTVFKIIIFTKGAERREKAERNSFVCVEGLSKRIGITA